MGHLRFKNTTFNRLFRNRRKQQVASDNYSQPSSLHNARPSWKCFSYQQIYIATNGFHRDNLVGRGGYAEVFKGVLLMEQTGEMKTVAVKRLVTASTSMEVEQKEKEFLSELGTIGHVRHPNISTLLGCCIHNEGLHLIFEFSFNGSVSSHLHDDKLAPAMTWNVRYKIVIGTAVGLAYLHKGCQRRIIHRDIKGPTSSSRKISTHRYQTLGLQHGCPTIGLIAPSLPFKELLDTWRRNISCTGLLTKRSTYLPSECSYWR
ncbi:hypothetical protein ZOSMA_169G00290 [Zostera marina]|uniref:Protein kinase domain-containing protein n=1 Tax=Zostera marina TaxID=29655 RepID=A0A0K9PVG8_ZOSMR|nr:hypothetical protein ZOSMA_169G00290 [Zostera marina]